MASRRSNKRKRRDRGRFGFLYKALSLVIILVAVAAGCVVFFRVEEIAVSGAGKYTAQEIIDASGVEKGITSFWWAAPARPRRSTPPSPMWTR